MREKVGGQDHPAQAHTAPESLIPGASQGITHGADHPGLRADHKAGYDHTAGHVASPEAGQVPGADLGAGQPQGAGQPPGADQPPGLGVGQPQGVGQLPGAGQAPETDPQLILAVENHPRPKQGGPFPTHHHTQNAHQPPQDRDPGHPLVTDQMVLSAHTDHTGPATTDLAACLLMIQAITAKLYASLKAMQNKYPLVVTRSIVVLEEATMMGLECRYQRNQSSTACRIIMNT